MKRAKLLFLLNCDDNYVIIFCHQLWIIQQKFIDTIYREKYKEYAIVHMLDLVGTHLPLTGNI